MRLRTVLLLAALSVLAIPATAPATPGPKAGVRLAGCDVGPRPAALKADRRAYDGAPRLQLRFTLQVFEDGAWERVEAPNVDVWQTAQPGKTRYVYDKLVQNL